MGLKEISGFRRLSQPYKGQRQPGYVLLRRHGLRGIDESPSDLHSLFEVFLDETNLEKGTQNVRVLGSPPQGLKEKSLSLCCFAKTQISYSKGF
jgi:hypothetical protein